MVNSPSFVDLQPRLFLEKVHLNSSWSFPEATLQRGDKMHVIISEAHQYKLLKHWLYADHPVVYQDNRPVRALGNALGMVLNSKGLLANISIKENIMLPFLCRNHPQDTEQAHVQLERVAVTLGLSDILEEQAGLRSPLIHGLVGLCRCLLQQSSFVLMQQPCASMSLKEENHFRPLAKLVIESLDAGMIYLTNSNDDTGDFTYTSQLNLTPREVDA